MILKTQHFDMDVNMNEFDVDSIKLFSYYFDEINPENEEEFRVQIGWMIYFLKKDNSVYRLLTPDLLNNPFVYLTENVVVSLKIHFEQVNLLKLLNSNGETCLFNQKIVYERGVLESQDYYLERTFVDEEIDSRWFVGSLEHEGEYEEGQLESVYVYELLFKNPSLLKLLSLPTGCLVVVESNEIVSIVDENNKELI